MNQIKKISILVPVYNEEDTLFKVFERIKNVELKNITKEIIFIDDASIDHSFEKLQILKTRDTDVKLVRHTRNQGKGAAIQSGLRQASGDLVLIQDADLEYNPEDYEKLIKPFIFSDADIVYGSRFLGGEYVRVLYFWHYLGNKILTTFSNMVTDLNLTDMETGFKVFKRSFLEQIPLKSKRFGFEVEVTARAAKTGAVIYEVPISYEGRTYKQGKKITWRDGMAAFWHVLRFNLF